MLRHFPLLLLAFSAVASAQTKTITFEDAKKWENLASPTISRDGHWVAYNVNVVDGDGRLVLRNVDSPQKKEFVGASPAAFSDDSKWVAFLLSPPRKDAERMRAERKPIHTKLMLVNLASGGEIPVDDVMRYRFVKGGRYLLAHRYRPETRKEGGSDLTVFDLETNSPITFGNVSDAEVNDRGDLLAMEIEPETGENGVQLLDLKSGKLSTLFWGDQKVGGMTWSAKDDALAYLIGKDDEKHDGIFYRVYLARNLRDARPLQYSFEPAGTEGFPKEDRITEFRLQVNDSGTGVALGVAPWSEKVKSKVRPEDRAGVEIWHTKDVETIPQQRVSLAADRRSSALAIWFPASGTFKVFGDGKEQIASPLGDFDRVLFRDPNPYRTAAGNGIVKSDTAIVDVLSGQKRDVLKNSAAPLMASPKGNFVAYFDKGAWFLTDTKTGATSNLTEKLGSKFEQDDYDGTSPIVPMANGPDWLADDAGIVIYDNFDAYLCRPGVPAVKLTDGKKEDCKFDLFPVNRKQMEDGVKLGDTFYFTAVNRSDYSTGFYACNAKGEGKMLTYDHVTLSGFRQADDVDRAIFVMQSFTKSPDLYVTNLAFSQAKPVSKLNPFASEFAWPKVEMIEYKSRFGKPLKGLLIYPADYQTNRRYPMVTYIYEKLSDQLNRYMGPNPWNPYNVQLMAQNGYFVLMPDITYKPRNPGKSAVDCLEPALWAVFNKRVGVDPDRVGLMGHSWGAYQTAFVTTVSKMFKVGVAGAPLTELTSMYNSFYWNSGTSDQVLFEVSQGRMEVPFWEDPKAYFENSPVWQSAKRTAPLLIMTGDADGAVDYHQSLYLYQTLRRMGKEAVMLVYAGENHNPIRRPNQLDYGTRLRHFFDVYLKGVKPEPWVTEGIPLTVQKKED